MGPAKPVRFPRKSVRGKGLSVEPTPKLTLEVGSPVLCMDFCPRAPRYFAVGTESGEVDLFDLMVVRVGEKG